MNAFEQPVEILHLNTRKEGEERDRLAIDVKVQATVDAEFIDELICGGVLSSGDALRAFWTENEHGEPRFLMLDEIKVHREVKGVNVELFSRGMYGCKISKFKFLPCAGHTARLTFSIQLHEPPGQVVELLASMLALEVPLKMSVPQGDLFGDAENTGGDDSKGGEE